MDHRTRATVIIMEMHRSFGRTLSQGSVVLPQDDKSILGRVRRGLKPHPFKATTVQGHNGFKATGCKAAPFIQKSGLIAGPWNS